MIPSPAERWEARYGGDHEYVYGTDPNEFLRQRASDLPLGDVLCVADGEGRNGVYLARLGHRVTSVDLSEAGMAKAARLASDSGVELTTTVADLSNFDFGKNRWDTIVSIFAHTPVAIRARMHGLIAAALRPGGHFLLEAYTPDQVGRGTGGPPTAELTMTMEAVSSELTAMTIIHRTELVRPVNEGSGHTGDGAVVQIVAVRNQ